MNHLRNGLQNITALSSRLRWTRGLTTAPRPRVQYSSSRRSSDRAQCVHSTCSRAATNISSHFGLNDSPFTRSALQAFQKHRVLYVDRSLVIINKPPGLTAQGTLSTDSAKRAETIQNAIDDLQEVLEQKEPLRTVHRLDKATTGALVLARNPKVIRTIHQQFDQRASQKVYLALVHDEELRQTLQSVPGSYFPQSVDHELRHGTIDAPILVDYHGNVALAQLDQTNNLPEGAKRGITEWQWLSHSGESDCISLLRLDLKTGLKHQIRVHLASFLKCPILGDHRYATDEQKKHRLIRQFSQPRLMLHASRISLIRYKKEGRKKQFKLSIVAPLPPDFVKICRNLDIPLTRADLEGGVLVDDEPCTNERLWEVANGHWIPGLPQ